MLAVASCGMLQVQKNIAQVYWLYRCVDSLLSMMIRSLCECFKTMECVPLWLNASCPVPWTVNTVAWFLLLQQPQSVPVSTRPRSKAQVGVVNALELLHITRHFSPLFGDFAILLSEWSFGSSQTPDTLSSFWGVFSLYACLWFFQNVKICMIDFNVFYQYDRSFSWFHFCGFIFLFQDDKCTYLELMLRTPLSFSYLFSLGKGLFVKGVWFLYFKSSFLFMQFSILSGTDVCRCQFFCVISLCVYWVCHYGHQNGSIPMYCSR